METNAQNGLVAKSLMVHAKVATRIVVGAGSSIPTKCLNALRVNLGGTRTCRGQINASNAKQDGSPTPLDP